MCKSTSFEEKSIFSADFIELNEVLVVTNWSRRLVKHQTLDILRLADFLSSFENHQ